MTSSANRLSGLSRPLRPSSASTRRQASSTPTSGCGTKRRRSSLSASGRRSRRTPIASTPAARWFGSMPSWRRRASTPGNSDSRFAKPSSPSARRATLMPAFASARRAPCSRCAAARRRLRTRDFSPALRSAHQKRRQRRMATIQKSTQPPPASRMTLKALVKGRVEQKLRVVAYGPEGVGKSTFGAGAPGAIFLGAEEGTAQLDVTRFPRPENWPEVFDALRVLTTEAHGYETLVVDTLDWLEPLIWAYCCQRDGMSNIEDYGYGKGYQVAVDEWRRFLAALDN